MALKITLALVVAILMVGVGLGFYRSIPSTETQTQPMSQTEASTTNRVTIGTTTIAVEVENTEASREQGLSGRASLAPGSGMLFVFPQEGNYGFWMKDMNFALDMIYANAVGTIVTIVPNATPESYTESPPKVFFPSAPAMYVLEVPSGFAAAHGITDGMTLQINQ